jgi:hypothetical protein
MLTACAAPARQRAYPPVGCHAGSSHSGAVPGRRDDSGLPRAAERVQEHRDPLKDQGLTAADIRLCTAVTVSVAASSSFYVDGDPDPQHPRLQPIRSCLRNVFDSNDSAQVRILLCAPSAEQKSGGKIRVVPVEYSAVVPILRQDLGRVLLGLLLIHKGASVSSYRNEASPPPPPFKGSQLPDSSCRTGEAWQPECDFRVYGRPASLRSPTGR